MVAPERRPLRTEVEIDEFFLGGLEEGRRGGRQHGEKALCGIAIEAATFSPHAGRRDPVAPDCRHRKRQAGHVPSPRKRGEG